MCRKSQLRGCCAIFLGLGVLIGYKLDSWLLCCCGGILLLIAGLVLMNRR